jgi:hypothetical protein
MALPFAMAKGEKVWHRPPLCGGADWAGRPARNPVTFLARNRQEPDKKNNATTPSRGVKILAQLPGRPEKLHIMERRNAGPVGCNAARRLLLR